MRAEQTPIETVVREASIALTKGLRQDRHKRRNARIKTMLVNPSEALVESRQFQKKAGEKFERIVNSTAHVVFEAAYLLKIGVEVYLESRKWEKERRRNNPSQDPKPYRRFNW